MDYKNIALELDAVEETCGRRLPQEMAKSAHGCGSLNPHPHGMHPRLVEHKKKKTREAVDAEITQAPRTRGEREAYY